MAIEHDAIVSAERHEPKGIESATSGQVYVADGANSGAWSDNEASTVASSAARYGEILTADGAGSSAWKQRVWKDLQGPVIAQGSGPGWPTFGTWRNESEAYHFSTGDEAHFNFHIPHDYAIGTDVYIHVHWGHNGTNISGNMVWDLEVEHAARTAGVPYGTFSTGVTPSINSNTISGTMNLTNFPQYCHVVEEIQLSASTPSATQIDTDDIAPDSIILVHITPSTIPTITGGTGEPFLFTVDIHYQADIEGTKNKDPNFYT